MSLVEELSNGVSDLMVVRVSFTVLIFILYVNVNVNVNVNVDG